MTRQYKDSGIEWIGQIPIDWKMQPLAIYFAENSKSNSDLGSVNALQFKYGEIIQKPNNGKELTDKDRELLEKYTVVSPDNIVVNGLNLNYDLKSLRIAKVREDGIITSAYIVLRPRNGANASFYNYYLKALDFQKIFHGMGVGIRLTLSYDELRSMLLAVPSFEEQQRIADYLDKKCAEIDGLIELQEQMIAQLTDYKQSVITEAVTKGLNPNVEFVPSGVDWIGDVPKGWKVCRIKDIFRLRTGTTPKDFETGLDSSELVNWFTPSDVAEMNCELNCSERHLSKAVVEKEGIELSPAGSLIFVGIGASAGKIGYATVQGYSNQQITTLIPKPSKCTGKYSYYYMIADRKRIRDNAFFTTLPIINNSYLSGIKTLLPSLEEQTSIASFLDKKCNEIDELITAKQKKIETLKEYKKSVIFEAVTGKIEIE